MQINSDFTVALNILITCEIFKNEKITANFIVNKTGSDGTTIREVMFKLKSAGFITNKPGPGGTTLSVDLNKLSLFDVYSSVIDPKGSILKLYNSDNEFSDCLNDVLDSHFNRYRDSFLLEMKKCTVKQLCDQIHLKY